MTTATFRPAVLALAIGLLCTPIIHSAALAQATGANTAKQQELEAARAELDRAAQRVARLSGELGDQHAMLIEHRLSQRPVLGVVLEPDAARGVRIAAVTPGSGAAKAGLRGGDRLTAIAGRALDASDANQRLRDARAALRTLEAKTPVALGYERGGRGATVKATPQPGERVLLMRDGSGNLLTPRGNVVIRDDADGGLRVEADEITAHIAPLTAATIAPQVQRELIRLGADPACKGAECRLPLLAEAFRWNGLHLASVDTQLGRYFGTDRGVLVLSSGPDLAGLQAGDVIQRIDGKTVASPREAMDALRDRPADSRVAVDYLRDRKAATVQVTVPKARALSLLAPLPPPAPPSPPTPPTAPEAPTPRGAAPVAPTAPPAPPPPPAPPAPPPAPAVGGLVIL